MTAAILLTGYALTAGALAPAALRRRWAWRAPQLAIGLWLVLSLSWIAAIPLALLAMTVPGELTWQGSPARETVAAHPAASAAGMVLATAVLAWAAACVACGLARVRRQRREHSAFLHAAARPDLALGALVLDQDAPAAYCLPGRNHRIVVTTGALATLTPAQLRAVLAHEQAHLRGRHHLLLATLSAIGRAFPLVPLLTQAPAQVAALAEMAADDQATRRHDPAELAAAVVALATARTRDAALTAGGPAAITRIQRLLAPPPRPGRPARTARLAAGVVALALPAAIACLPLIAAACDVAARP